MYKKISITLFSIFLFTQIFAQKGYIRGTVFDAGTGEYLPGVNVVIKGTTIGTITDLDGKFNLSVQPGTYHVIISFISYQTDTIKNIKVSSGGSNVIGEISLAESTVELNEVVVKGEVRRSNETALLAMKRKSTTLLDGISAAKFRKIGDSDAASSMKRVSGVSVSGGKYVYVRGLGDRYTKTLLNGLDIPGLDPDRNTLQMDIFPTNIIENIIVNKSFSAELPADFTGGLIDINIIDFPEEKTGKISVSSKYNPSFHFNNNYLTYEGGKTDYLGFDDGTREIPAKENIPNFTYVTGNPDSKEAKRFKEILNSFNPNMAAYKTQSFMDYGIGTSFGNQIPLNNVTLGYIFSLSYNKSIEFFENAEFGRYAILQGNEYKDVYEMERREYQIGNYGIENVFISGLAGFAVKTKQSKYKIKILHLQNGESEAGIFNFKGSDQGSVFNAIQHGLDYSQRSLTNIFFGGNHNFYETGWDIRWKLSPTISKLYNPDARFTRYELRDDGAYRIGTEVGFPQRNWRDLEEINFGGVLQVTKDIELFGRKSKIRFGGSETYKQRDFRVYIYQLNIRNIPLTGDPDELFHQDNLWPYNEDFGKGTTYEAAFLQYPYNNPEGIPNNPNKFNANTNNIAGYISSELALTENFNTNIGARVEHYTQHYTGLNQQGLNLNDSLLINDLNVFPAINLNYILNPYQNIRMSYSMTIARPSLKELSFAEIYDPISGKTFIGGLFSDKDNEENVLWDGNLESATIHNLDLRWELIQSNGQMFSISGYYKKFNNPIEIVQHSKQTGAFQPRNVGDGEIFGTEFEFRLGLATITNQLQNISISSNITLTRSRIKMSPTEHDSRAENARLGETIDEYRNMAGQAPYIINSGISYNGGKNGFWKNLEAGLFYHIKGKTLYIVGIVDRPNIYTNPFHSLNFNANKAFGTNKRIQVGLKVSNILDDKKEKVFQSYKAQDQFYERLYSGRTYSFKISYAIF